MSVENGIPTTLTMQGYLPRVAGSDISGALQRRGAVLIEGCRGCGKTWAARHFARSEARLDAEELMLLAATDPGAVLDGAPPSSATFAAESSTATLSVATENDATYEADARVTASVNPGSALRTA